MRDLLGLLPQYHDLFTACQHPCGHKVTLLRQRFVSRNATQPLKCKGRCIAVQFPISACLFQIIPRPVVRGKWPFIWGSEDLIFLLHHFSSLCFCPFPFSALNSQRCLFFPLTFSPTPVPSHDPKWCRSSCSRAQVNRQSVPIAGKCHICCCQLGIKGMRNVWDRTFLLFHQLDLILYQKWWFCLLCFICAPDETVKSARGCRRHGEHFKHPERDIENGGWRSN